MKLNKIEVVSKTSVTDLEGVSSLSDTHIQLRYMTDEGGWHRTTFAANKDSIDDLPDHTADEKALLQSICDQACAVPETSNIKRLDFFCSPQLIKMDENGNYVRDQDGKLIAYRTSKQRHQPKSWFNNYYQ